MAKNIFSEKSHEKLNIKRNAYDKSFQNNLTMSYGKMYPCFVKEVMPNESISINPTFGLNFMPMVFPVQTKMYVNLMFFYVRYRSLWEDWQDFITNVKPGLVPPFIAKTPAEALRFFSTGSLADYMNIPTQVDSTTRQTRTFWFWTPDTIINSPLSVASGSYRIGPQTFIDVIINGSNSRGLTPMPEQQGYSGYKRFLLSELSSSGTNTLSDIMSYFNGEFSSIFPITIPGRNYSPWSVADGLRSGDFESGNLTLQSLIDDYFNFWWNSTANVISANASSSTTLLTFNRVNTLREFSLNAPVFALYCQSTQAPLTFPSTAIFASFNANTGELEGICHMKTSYDTLLSSDGSLIWETIQSAPGTDWNTDLRRMAFIPIDQDEYNTFVGNASDSSYLAVVLPTHNLTDILPYHLSGGVVQDSYNSWFGASAVYDGIYPAVSSALPFSLGTSDQSDPNSDPARPISAMPFRAYEAIYNAYFRRQQVDPFTINGVEEPNKWITTNKGGRDTTNYDFYTRDWEPDYLTTAFTSPQQGEAPLVGAVGSSVLSVTDSNGVTYNIDTIIGEDGETIVGIQGYDKGTPIGAVQRLMANITSGVSINDFRLVNSLQRFLERSLRAGFRYRDLMRAHHGVNIKFNPLDMPEFIGGISDVVEINKVVNQSAIEGGNPLGAFAGLASAFKKSKHNITSFCDEHGLIMGVISVSPVPVYTQTLEKFWCKQNFLDYYTPEFARIGMQPITYNEVSPILRYNESLSDPSKSLNDVFGYQRAWYEYQSSTDQAHGEFRKSLRNFVMYRLFGQSPILGKDFIHVRESDLNNVFAYTEQTDKILGMINFQVSEKLPVLRHMVPGLE